MDFDMARVFLSHNHKDKDFANKLGTDLEEHGVRVWIDEAELEVGDSLIKKIESAIAEVDYLAAVLSKNSISSEWVKRELEIALNREIHNKRVFVLPLLIDDCDIPGFLQGRIFIDYREKSKYQQNLEKILQRLGAKHAVPPPPPAQKGLKPYAIPVHAFREDTGYQYIGSIPSDEDGIYVNMVYLTLDDIVVDLLVPGAIYDIYRKEIHDNFHYESNRYSEQLGWIEVYIHRKGKTPQEVEGLCLNIIATHNEELRWLLHFANPR
jgi:hypothetical protein